jgi:hypothetical protein
MEPDDVIPLTPDVIAYAFADTDLQPGAELLLLTANGCFGYRLQSKGDNRPQDGPGGRLYKIAECEFLWQLPDQDHVFSWQRAILDLDGDGRADVFMPESGGYRMLLQGTSGFVSSPLLVIPSESDAGDAAVRMDKDQSGVKMSFELEGLGQALGIDSQQRPLVNVYHAIHVPLFIDFDGDHRCDIVTETSKSLYVWQQGIEATFPETPTLNLKLPKDVNDHFDLAAHQYVLDLNRDERCDFILFARDKQAKHLSTQILIYLNQGDVDQEGHPLFGKDGIPQQLLKVAGLPGEVQLEDINSDGYPDLSFLTFRPDLLDQVKTLASKSIKFQCLAFLNHQGRFSRTPELMQDVFLSLQEEDQSAVDQGQFFVDYDDDGLLDVLVRDAQNHIGLRLLKRTKNGMRISETDVWDMTIPEDSRIIRERNAHNSEPVLLIVGHDQIMHVRFK